MPTHSIVTSLGLHDITRVEMSEIKDYYGDFTAFDFRVSRKDGQEFQVDVYGSSVKDLVPRLPKSMQFWGILFERMNDSELSDLGQLIYKELDDRLQHAEK